LTNAPKVQVVKKVAKTQGGKKVVKKVAKTLTPPAKIRCPPEGRCFFFFYD
jgi:hypothetical protein